MNEAYRAFFQKSEHSREFMVTLEKRILANHDKAESEPENARDYSQRAKGIKEIKHHILSVTASKKGISM